VRRIATFREATRRIAAQYDALLHNATINNSRRSTMRVVNVTLQGTSPYSQSKHYVKDANQGESQDDCYRRTWREHMHTDVKGEVFIPPTSIKNCLSEAAQFMSIPVPGKGKATYTKNFEAGIIVAKPIYIFHSNLPKPLSAEVSAKTKQEWVPYMRDEVEHEALFLPSDGKRGGSKRVMKYYPVFPEWRGDAELIIVDETVLQTSARDKNRTVLQEVLEGAGQFIGIGRYRPRKNGYYGRFEILSFEIER
jgi:hypothetical protein